MRYVMARVFPVSAPARISTGPSIAVAASRCPVFSSSRSVMMESGPLEENILSDARWFGKFSPSSWVSLRAQRGGRSQKKEEPSFSSLKKRCGERGGGEYD